MPSGSFSVLTVSKRTGWELVAMQALINQTSWSPIIPWVIVTEKVLNKELYELQKDIGNPQLSPAPKQIRASNLNRSLNFGLKQIQSDYVIFYQDFIDLPEGCFEKLLSCADERTFVTTATINPDGSNDARYSGADTVHRIRPEFWEANVAIAPMKIIRELGGFEEELDNGWAWDNVHLAQRAAMLGCRFLIDETNRPQLLAHELTSKLKLELNDKRCANSIAAIRMGKAPLRLNYL